MTLLIDTTTSEARIWLLDGEQVRAHQSWAIGPDLTARLITAIDVMTSAVPDVATALRRIAVHAGPGKNFMALRTGILVAQMVAEGRGLKLVVVDGDTPEDLIATSRTATPVLVVKPYYPENGRNKHIP